MKMSKENYDLIIKQYKHLIDRVGMQTLQNEIRLIKFKKDKNVSIAFYLIRFTPNYFNNVFSKNYKLGLNDSHIQTALIKACKELKIIS